MSLLPLFSSRLREAIQVAALRRRVETQLDARRLQLKLQPVCGAGNGSMVI